MIDDQRFEIQSAFDLLPHVVGCSWATIWFRLNKIKNPLPKNFETAKSEPKGRPNIHENKSEKNEIFKDNKIISSKSKFNEKIRFKEFLNISVNSTTYIIYFFIYYKVYVSKI